MARYCWSKLENKSQVGKYAEYFVKMELTMYGLYVYQPEIDDHGIDFIAKSKQGNFIEMQVKSLRLSPSNLQCEVDKENFELREHLYLALVLFYDGALPELYLIPSLDWKEKKNKLFAIYADKWGINASKRNMPLLEEYSFDKVIETLL